MGQRIDLHQLICNKLSEIESIGDDAAKHVYYSPPEDVKLRYPCVVYKIEDIPSTYANNLPYHWDYCYQMTVIDRDPESAVRDKMLGLQFCRFSRMFVADNLHHYVFRIYY